MDEINKQVEVLDCCLYTLLLVITEFYFLSCLVYRSQVRQRDFVLLSSC